MAHISKKNQSLDWLPIKERLNECINSIAFKYFYNQCLQYFNEVESPKSGLLLRKS